MSGVSTATILSGAALAAAAGGTAFSMLRGGGPSSPTVLTAGNAPTLTDPSVQAAAEAQRTTAANAAGRASTILTSGLGDTSPANVTRKQLLGG